MKTSHLCAALLACLSVLAVSGCSTPSKTAVLLEVDRLCVTEAFYRVYKTVELPACSFTKAGEPLTKLLRADKYDSEVPNSSIRVNQRMTFMGGTSASTQSRLVRFDYEIIDSSDQSVVGKAVDFCGSGPAYLVDAPRSGRCCPSEPRQTLHKQALKKGDTPCK